MSNSPIVSALEDYAQSRALCDGILSALPDWFGGFENYKDYLDDLKDRPVIAAGFDGQQGGIMALTRTSEASVDIHLMAVHPDCHRQGIGQALVQSAMSFAQSNGAQVLTVKTLGPSLVNDPYAQTRHFYAAQGFVPIEEFPDFWAKGYPMLLLCQSVNSKPS